MAILEKEQTKKRSLVEMSWDPITRIVGNLGIFTKIDFDNREVAECYSTSSVFRGYSIFMKGKDPRDAHFITSRICGICGDNHATCSCYAQQMAYGVRPPAIAEWIVNLGEAAEYMFDHNIFQDNLGNSQGGPGRHRLRQVHRQQRQDIPAQDRAQARSGIRVEGAAVEQRD